MSVHEIKRISYMDVPGKLHELAVHVEREKLQTAIVIIGHDNGRVSVRGYGTRTSALEAIGWLHRALDFMTDGSSADWNPEAAPPPAA